MPRKRFLGSMKLSQNKTNGYEHIFKQTILDENIRQMITNTVNNKNEQYTNKIKTEDNVFQGPDKETNLDSLIKKWKTDLNKFDLKDTLSLIYAKETKLIKRDLDRNMKTIEENAQILGTSDGFKFVGKQIGFHNEKMIIKRGNLNFTPNLDNKSKSMSYSQLRELRNHELEEKK